MAVADECADGRMIPPGDPDVKRHDEGSGRCCSRLDNPHGKGLRRERRHVRCSTILVTYVVRGSAGSGSRRGTPVVVRRDETIYPDDDYTESVLQPTDV